MNRVFLWALLLLTGCVHQPPPSAPPAPDIGQLQAQHRYVAALAAVDSLSASAAAGQATVYAQQREAILTAARDYQAELLRGLNDLLQQQQFAEAQRQFAAAQPELPPAPELDQFAEQLNKAADRYVQRYLGEIVQLRSASLLREQSLYHALQKGAADPELQRLVERQQADTDYFAAQLARLGARALTQNELTKGTQYLGLANQLAPSPELAQQLKCAEQMLAATKQKRQTARSTEREQHYRELTAAFQQSMQQLDYIGARVQLDQAKTLAIHGDELEQAQEQLDSAIAIFVDQQVDAGNRSYSEGHLEVALQRWRRAAVLMPSPQLTERIEKAQRFIDRLEQLRSKQY